MVKGIIALAIVASSTTTEAYREAAHKWRGVAQIRLEKNLFLQRRLEDQSIAIQNQKQLIDIKPAPEVKNEVPTWLWLTWGAGLITAAVVGAYVGSLTRPNTN
jgi:hypothetical protein